MSCAIIKSLQGRLIYIPKNDELKSILETYREKWGFPMCAGAIDGTHIPTIAPKEDHTDYVNRTERLPQCCHAGCGRL